MLAPLRHGQGLTDQAEEALTVQSSNYLPFVVHCLGVLLCLRLASVHIIHDGYHGYCGYHGDDLCGFSVVLCAVRVCW